MSTEATAGISPSLNLARAKYQGLRVALAVTVGFSMGLVNGSVLPFLAPLFATQFLLASYSPPSLRQARARARARARCCLSLLSARC